MVMVSYQFNCEMITTITIPNRHSWPHTVTFFSPSSLCPSPLWQPTLCFLLSELASILICSFVFCFPWDSTELFTQWWGPSTGISNMPKGCRCCWSHRIHWSKQPAIITALFSLILTPRRSTRVRAQFCPTFCEHMDCSPPGSPVHGISQARILEWAAISFSNIWKWKMKVKSLSCVWLLATPWTAAYQGPPSMGFSRQEDWSGVPLPSPKKELQAQ